MEDRNANVLGKYSLKLTCSRASCTTCTMCILPAPIVECAYIRCMWVWYFLHRRHITFTICTLSASTIVHTCIYVVYDIRYIESSLSTFLLDGIGILVFDTAMRKMKKGLSTGGSLLHIKELFRWHVDCLAYECICICAFFVRWLPVYERANACQLINNEKMQQLYIYIYIRTFLNVFHRLLHVRKGFTPFVFVLINGKVTIAIRV